MIEVVLNLQTHGHELDHLSRRALPARNGVGARVILKHVIEAAVLLNDVDHVLDLPGSGHGKFRKRAPS
jgi:hypothetical protein